MSEPLKKLCASVRPDIFEMARKRQSQCPYTSESDWLTALILADCRFQQPQTHAFGARVLNQPAKQRDEDLTQIVHDFPSGAKPMTEADLAAAVSSVFADYLKNLPVRLQQMPEPEPARVRAIKSGAKPATRRR